MGGIERRIGRLERCSGLDDALMEEARGLIAAEALKRVSDEDLHVMAELAERMPDATGEELALEAPEMWRRYEEIWREVGEELACGR